MVDARDGRMCDGRVLLVAATNPNGEKFSLRPLEAVGDETLGPARGTHIFDVPPRILRLL